MTRGGNGGGRRETRLLLATIAVSVGMLLLLARFRFPEEAARQTVEPAPAPLERLAARATFDELAGIMADLERRVLPAMVTLAGQGEGAPRFVPAVRLTPNRAVGLMPGDWRLTAGASGQVPKILLRDAVRGLVVVEPPPDGNAAPAVPATAGRPGPRYIAVVEAAGGALAIRPFYVGRIDPVGDPRWADPLLSISAAQQTVAPGAAAFSLEGAFIGLVTVAGGRVAIVPADTLRNSAISAPAPSAQRAELPLDVQPLTTDLAKAAGASEGVMVSYVRDPAVPLQTGDVIRTVDGTPVTSVGVYQAVVQSRTPGEPVKLTIVRRGAEHVVAVTPRPADRPHTAAAEPEIGAVLRPVRGIGVEVVTVEPDAAAHRAGIRRGDLIIAIDGMARPEPADVIRQFRAAPAGRSLLLTIRRDGNHRVVAMEKR